MKKFSKKLALMLVLAMIVGMFSGVLTASAANAPFTSNGFSFATSDGALKNGMTLRVAGKTETTAKQWYTVYKDGAKVNGSSEYSVVYSVDTDGETMLVLGTGKYNGLVRAKSVGLDAGCRLTATIFDANDEKVAQISTAIYVRESAAKLEITNKDAAAEALIVGKTLQLTSLFYNAAGQSADTAARKTYVTDYTKWTSSDETIATVDATGLVTGVKEGTATIKIETFVAKDCTGTATASDTIVVVVGSSKLGVVAKKANVLEVTFNKAVDTTDVTLAVTKGTTAVAATTAWNEDKTVATVTTTANMTSGTHTVTGTSKADATVKLTGTVEITAQKVAEIKILSEVALTGSSVPTSHDARRAYIYYDVVDQYGQSLRTTTNLQWSFSAEKVTENKTTGMITLKRSDNNAFTFNEQIYISAVDTKTGIAVTKTVTVGQKQALNSIELAGYLKKGTTEIVKQLPAGFQDGTYYMLYTTKDQNGNAFATSTPVANNEITLIADNALLISKIKDGETKINLAGVEYNAVFVSPGINVDKGGEVNITAIANNTGNKVVINTAIGAYQILTSFNMSAPTTILADGETVVIPFEALDQDGKKITNFTTIARNATFNKLTFNTTFGTLKLAEQADGTAKLTYSDIDQLWNLATTTDGQDRVVSLTSIVVGGNTSSQMLSIQDKARPVGISAVTMDLATVEAGTIALNLSNTDSNTFTFVDQYGRTMTRANASAFFAASPASFANHNNEFAGYTYVVRATYKGDAGVFTNPASIVAGSAVVNNQEFEIVNGTTSTFTAGTNVTESAKSGMAFDFEVVKYKVADGFANAQAVSPKVTKSSAVVDITSVKGYAIKDMDKIHVQTDLSSALTGVTGGLDHTTIVSGASLAATSIPSTHVRTVEVTGLYNGIVVKIPSTYLTVSSVGNKLVASGSAITAGNAAGFKWSDFYDATTAQYTRKDTTDTIKVTITQLYVSTGSSFVVDSASKVVTISDEAPKATTITGKDAFTVAPTTTNVTSVVLADADHGNYKVKDQYNVAFTSPITYRVTTIVEAKEGYATNNFKVTGNDSAAVTVNGAERLDTFDLVVKAGNATITSKVTVDADTNANISNGNNNYLDFLINSAGALEAQRQAGLN